MGKRSAALLPVASSMARIDVDRCLGKPGVLCSIENVVASHHPFREGLKSPVAKKQRCLELNQTPATAAPLDVSCLFSQARTLLRQPPACTSDAPIGREQQSKQIQGAVQSFVESGCGKSVYISGLPGTGKSHTVRKVLQQLQASQPDAASITWINCMSITSPNEVYAQVAAAADGCSSFASFSSSAAESSGLVSPSGLEDDLAFGAGSAYSGSYSPNPSSSRGSTVSTYDQLIERLLKPYDSTPRASIRSSSSSSKTSARPAPKSHRASRLGSKQASSSSSSLASDDTAPAADVSSSTGVAGAKHGSSAKLQEGSSSSSRRYIVVLDEIDNLAKKSTAALVQLFLLPHEPGLQVLLIGIANSIDLTERTLPELKLKLVSPELICFPAYSTKQLAAILAACMEALPCKLFEPPAIELCARSVATSSGDLRHALKACRAAIDELERQHKQQRQASTEPAAAGESAAGQALPTVTARYMIGALKQLASGSVRSSHFGAQATSSIRSLPNQQQLLLYSLSVLCRPRDAAPEEGPGDQQQPQKKKQRSDAASLWKSAGSAVVRSSSGGGAASGSKAGKKLGPGAVGGGASQQVFVLSVGLEEAYCQYKQVCKLLSLPPCSRPELLHMAELLSLGHTGVALVDVIRAQGSSSGGSSSSTGGSSAGGLGSGVRGFGGGRAKGGLGGLGGLGMRSLVAGGSKAGVGGAGGGGGEVRLSLKASVEEVEAALQHNPALRCLVQK